MNILYRALIILTILITPSILPVFAKANGLLYVTHTSPDNIGVYDTSKLEKVGRILVGKDPLDIALSPDSKWLAVSHRIGGGERPDVLWIIDIESREIVRKIEIYLTRDRNRGESYLIFSKDGKKIYAVDSATGFLNVVDLLKGRLAKKVALGLHPQNPILSQDGKRLYVPCLYSRDIKVIDTGEDVVVDALKIDGLPSALAFSRNEKTIYVSDMEGHRVLFIDMITRMVTKEVSVGSAPLDSLMVDDRFLYVVNTHANNLSVIDTMTKKNVKSFAAGFLPKRMAFDPEGKRLYVLAMDSSIKVYDTAKQRYIRSIAADITPSGIVFIPSR